MLKLLGDDHLHICCTAQEAQQLSHGDLFNGNEAICMLVCITCIYALAVLLFIEPLQYFSKFPMFKIAL